MKLGITMLVHNKDDIQILSEFPCFLGHSVDGVSYDQGSENGRSTEV